jgi:hypothetical protein
MGISKEALQARLDLTKKLHAEGRISKDVYYGLVKATIELHLESTVETANKELNKNTGNLTAYDFACGYVQREGEVRLYKDGVYHVQAASGYWESYGTLTEARRDYARQVKLWKKSETAEV